MLLMKLRMAGLGRTFAFRGEDGKVTIRSTSSRLSSSRRRS
jgi:hypothetical protein